MLLHWVARVPRNVNSALAASGARLRLATGDGSESIMGATSLLDIADETELACAVCPNY